MMRQLTQQSRTFILSGPVAAGVDGAFAALTTFDARGYETVRVIIHVGAIATNGVINARLKNHEVQGTPGAGTVNRVGSNLVNAADTDDDKLMIFEVYRPRNRWFTLEYQRTVGNVTINSVIVELINPIPPNQAPIAQASADVMASASLVSPVPSAA